MRGKSSSKQGSKGGIEIDKIDKIKEEPHLSGAYIRNLVKQLTSSRNKDPMNTNEPDSADGGDGFPSHHQNLAKFGDDFSVSQQSQPPQQPQQHKKQVRRRLHTSRPYQERLLNMAEARREIVTALKFHRAAMKQANEQRQTSPPQPQPQFQPQPQPLQPQLQPSLEQEGKIKSRRNPRIYPSSTASYSSYLDNLSYSTFTCPSPSPNLYSWSSTIASPPTCESLNLTLPNQTLGLNLNFQDFSNLDATQDHNNPSIYYSSSSPSSSSSPTFSIATEDVPSSGISQEGLPAGVPDVANSTVMPGGDLGLHPALDDEEMAKIRSIGEQHQMEWDDTLNLVRSAWWFKFLRTMEIGPEEKAEDNGYHPFDEVMEFPAWLNANESFLQQHLDEHCSDDYLQDPALPCMDIGEFEGMDVDWLS
ncbi:uncharacterized protein LOC132308099 [Cornus florida]|uniref:uncharacterized protein LOC132308099 n=1 Tax=Cornus florida TaxID=4283 RepID=UPI00289DF9B0|nr:uncharacterized protein LOC132308099 [Cornus florida]